MSVLSDVQRKTAPHSAFIYGEVSPVVSAPTGYVCTPVCVHTHRHMQGWMSQVILWWVPTKGKMPALMRQNS